MKKIILIIFYLFTFYHETSAQETCNEFISIHIEIIGKRNPEEFLLLRREVLYFAKVEIKNNQDSAILLNMMNCSWQDSWVSDNDSIFLRGVGCDGNSPIQIFLLPGEVMTLYSPLHRNDNLLNKKFKVGFMMLGNKELFEPHRNIAELRNTKTTYWSNTISLKDALNRVVHYLNIEVPFEYEYWTRRQKGSN